MDSDDDVGDGDDVDVDDDVAFPPSLFSSWTINMSSQYNHHRLHPFAPRC